MPLTLLSLTWSSKATFAKPEGANTTRDHLGGDRIRSWDLPLQVGGNSFDLNLLSLIASDQDVKKASSFQGRSEDKKSQDSCFLGLLPAVVISMPYAVSRFWCNYLISLTLVIVNET